MSHEPLTYYHKEKAIDLAMWKNFEHRLKNQRFGAVRESNGSYTVVPTDHPAFKDKSFKRLPKSYKRMGYDDIQVIAMDSAPLDIWEAVLGMVAMVDGESLRFILKYQVPLQKFIRFELAARGYDVDNHWCGFEKAKEVWLK